MPHPTASLLRGVARGVGLGVLCAVPGLLAWLQARAWAPTFGTWHTFAWYLLVWGAWALVVPPVRGLVRRLVERRAPPRRLVGTLALTWLGVLAVRMVTVVVVGRLLPTPAGKHVEGVGLLWLAARSVLFHDSLVFVAATGLFFALEYRRRLRDELVSAARMEAELTRAEMDAFRVQIRPQLVFDTLRTTAEVVRAGESASAVLLLARLSQLLRLMLGALGCEEASLARELGFLDAYLGVQELRSAGRLRVRRDVEPGALVATVPCLSLLQLAELSPWPEAGLLEIRARRAGERLRVELSQSELPPGVDATPPPDGEDRLACLRTRLEQLHPRDHLLDVHLSADGLCVALELPFVAAAEDDTPEGRAALAARTESPTSAPARAAVAG